MTAAFEDMVARLWQAKNPYTGFPKKLYRRDMQGWNSEHGYLALAIDETSPSIIVEIGVWKGGSTIHMAKHAKARGLNTVVIAVDTFLGSWEHWRQPEFFADLSFNFGFPQLYYTFAANVLGEGVADYVLPLPLDSANALQVLSHLGIRPGVIHIDGGHDYEAALSDIRRWWDLLTPGGRMVVDDYDPTGAIWQSVRDAVDSFREENTSVSNFRAAAYKAILTKLS